MVRSDEIARQGLYDPAMERDSCGLGLVVSVNGDVSHRIVTRALGILRRLSHRGAVDADGSTGDGAGILLQIPHAFLAEEMALRGVVLPPPGDYAAGMLFLPRSPQMRLFCEGRFERVAREEGLLLLGWRELPVDRKPAAPRESQSSPPFVSVFAPSVHCPGGIRVQAPGGSERAQREIAASEGTGADAFYGVQSLPPEPWSTRGNFWVAHSMLSTRSCVISGFNPRWP
jgi:glutamate synthase domain-containing protein 1